MLPKGWNLCQFGEVAEVGSGQVDPKVEPYASMIHIGPENIESGTGRILSPRKCSELGLISGKYEFDEDAVIYSKIRPHLNKVCFPGFKGVCSADAYPIWPDKTKLLPEYLKHYMLGRTFEKRAVACSMRTGMPKINREDLDGIPIVVPPLSEQRRITKILSTWDQAISATERLLANSEEQKLGLMQVLLDGKHRLDGHTAGWQEHLLGKLFAERVEPNRDDLQLLSITREQGVILRDDVGRKDTSNEDKSKYLRICPGDIGYNTMRMWQGVSALSQYEGIISPAYTVITPGVLIDGKFASYLFKSQSVVFLFYRHSQGLVSDTWNLKFSHFAKIKIKIPCIQEQRSIAEVLEKADQQIAVIQRQLLALREEKAALMSQLLTGKRRVKLLDAETEAHA